MHSSIATRTWVPRLTVLVLAFAAVAASHAQSTSAQAGTSATSASAPAVARADRRFVETAAEANLAEIELGRLAQQRAASDPVKQFAAHMIEDHGKASTELQAVAAARGLQWPAGPNRSQRRAATRLAKLSGAEFDRSYMSQMVEDHRKNVADFQKASSAAQDGEVKAFASRTLPALQSHLQMAQSVQAALPAAGASR